MMMSALFGNGASPQQKKQAQVIGVHASSAASTALAGALVQLH
jgi:hypothetical protein